MNLFEMALAQSRANPAVSDAEDKYEQLRLRYNQLVNDFKNLQETYRYDTNDLKEALRYVSYQRLPLGNTVFDTLDESRQLKVIKLLE